MTTIVPEQVWTEFSTSPIDEPGHVVRDDSTGLSYVYVYNAGASDIADNDVVGVFATVARGSVSTTAGTMLDITEGTTVRSAVAGIAVGAIAAGSYGWLWCGGFDTAGTCTTGGSVAAGNYLTLADGTKVAISNLTAASAHTYTFGYSFAADSSTTLTGLCLTNCFFNY